MPRRPFNPPFWVLTQIGSRIRTASPALPKSFADDGLRSWSLQVRTRHGTIRALVFEPGPQPDGSHSPRPVVLHLHGGGFINRYPEQDANLARFLVATLGVVVVLPDYSTAPKVRYPVAEEQMFDVASWIRETAANRGWDAERLLLSGISAGAKLAINVCQQLHAAQAAPPAAIALTVPVTDMTRTDRTSVKQRPAISPAVQRVVAWAWVPDVGRRLEPLASPRFDPRLSDAMPPTLVQTAALDTLAPEGTELARVLRSAGIEVRFREYPDADHGFYAGKPLNTVHQMLEERADFFRRHL